MRIAILSIDLTGLACAHAILDETPDSEVHLLSELAEVGLLDEGPGILSEQFEEIVPNDWVHNLRNQQPTKESSAVRRSWLERAMASRLAERGATLHLRTSHSHSPDHPNRSLQLSGVGYAAGSTIEFDHILVSPKPSSPQVWNGGVHLGQPNLTDYEGCRPDGTVEIWWRKEEDEPLCFGSWIQSMEWIGEDPQEALALAIREGRSLAASIL